MIARLIGHLHVLGLDEAIVDVGGVGYHVFLPVGTAARVQTLDDGRAMLLIHTSVREDAIQLFGFATETEKALYRKLIAVSGVGPKLGLSVLSGLDASELVRAIQSADVQAFTRVKGVGKKTAQRLVLELANALADLPSDFTPAVVAPGEPPQLLDDLRSALTNLDYKPPEIERVIAELQPVSAEHDDMQSLLRRAFKLLRG